MIMNLVCSMFYIPSNQKALNKRHINTLERETASLGPIMVSPDYVSNGYMLKMLEIFEREDLVEQSRVKGEYFKNKFLELQKKYPEIIKDVRGLGLSIGVDLCDKNTTTKIIYECQLNGLVLISLGESTLRVQPPLVITYEQMDKSIEIIEQAIKDLIDGKISDEALSVINGW